MRVSMVVTMVLAIALMRSRANAEEPSPLDGAAKLGIEDLLKVAVRVAPELKTAAFDVSLAAANHTAAWGIEDWTASLSSTNLLQKSPSATNNNYQTAAKVSRLLPTNGTVTFGATSSKSLHSEPRANSRFVNLDFSVVIVQPVLANAGAAVQKAQIRQTKHALSAATIRRTASARTFVASVAESYWRLALAWRRLAVVQLSLDVAEKQLATIQRGVGTGAIAKSEVLPFELSILSRKVDIANAEGDIVAQSLALRTLVGLEIPPDAPVIQTIELPRATFLPIKNSDLVKNAIAASDDLAAAMEDVRGAEALLAAADRNLMPSLDFSLQSDVTGVHNNFADAFGEIRFNRGYSVVAGAAFALPIGQHAVKGAYAANRANVARARFDVSARRKAIASDVIGLATKANIIARTVELSEQVVKLAQQNVDAEQRKFELGKSTSNEVVRRQSELETARLQVANANADAAIVVAKLEAATGRILPHYGIKMIDHDQLTNDELVKKP